MAIGVSNSLYTVFPSISLDAFFGPYLTVEDANAIVTTEVRLKGKKVGIYEGGVITGNVLIYSWVDGIENLDLVPIDSYTKNEADVLLAQIVSDVNNTIAVHDLNQTQTLNFITDNYSTKGWVESFNFFNVDNFGKTEIDLLNINAGQLNGVSSTQFLRSDIDDTFEANLTINGNTTHLGTVTGLDAIADSEFTTLSQIASLSKAKLPSFLAYTNSPNNFTGNQTVIGDLNITGQLFVSGDITQVNGQINTEDSVVELNYGEVGSGVTLGYSGFSVDRGTEDNFWFGFDEVRNRYTVGEISSLSTSQIATTLVLATVADTLTDSYIPVFDVFNGYFTNSKIFETNTGISVNGSVTATSLYGDGSSLTGLDNYQSWNLKTNGIQRTTVQSGGNLDLVAGSNVSLSYGAGGIVTINSSFTDTNTQLSDTEISAFGYIKTDTNTQLSNAEVLAITDPKYLLNTTDTFVGVLDLQGSLNVTGGTIISSLADFNTKSNSLFKLTNNAVRLAIGYDASDQVLIQGVSSTNASKELRLNPYGGLVRVGNGLVVNGNVTASNFIGNGSLLTDISYNDLEDKPTFTDTNTQLSNAEVLAITDPKYLLNTTDTFNGDLTVMGSGTFGGNLSVTNNLIAKGGVKLGLDNSYSLIRGTAYSSAISIGTSSGTWDRDLHLGYVDGTDTFSSRVKLVNQTGNFLIGTETDNTTDKLQVNGSGYFAGSATFGGTVQATNINISNIPTSSSGLSSGDVWNDGGTLKIIT